MGMTPGGWSSPGHSLDTGLYGDATHREAEREWTGRV